MCFHQKSFHETSDFVLVWDIKTHWYIKKHVTQTNKTLLPLKIQAEHNSCIDMFTRRYPGGVRRDLQQWLGAQNVIHLYLTSNRVESSSSSLSSFKGAISTRSAGVVMMSYFRVFLIFFADLHIFMTRHVISKTVNTQMEIEKPLMVGRSLKIVEIRDPSAQSVSLCDECSSWGGNVDVNVELSGIAEDGRICGSPFTSCALTTRAIAKVYSHMLFPCINCLLNVLYI